MRREKRFDSVSRYEVPVNAVHLAERRCGGMVEEWTWQQTFSANLPGLPSRPTLLDLVASAYLQGVNDCAETFARKGLFLPE